MSSDINNRENMEKSIIRELISKIDSMEEEHSRIYFWKEDERIVDEDVIELLYEDIYHIFVDLPKFKYGKKRPRFIIHISKNWGPKNDPLYYRLNIRLEPATISYLKQWGRNAAQIIYEYLLKDDYHLSEVRFDLLPDKENPNRFIIPNIPLCNVHFYYPFKGEKIVNLNDYLDQKLRESSKEAEIENLQAAESFRQAMLAAQNKPSP